VFWRWTLSALILLFLAAGPLWRARHILWAHFGLVLTLGLLNCVLFSLAIIAAPFGTSAANVGLIQATAPLWVVAAGALLWAERPSGRVKIGLVLGFAGASLLILTGREQSGFPAGLRWGDVAALVATLIWAGYSLALRKAPANLHPVTLFGAIVLIGYVGLVVCCVLMSLLGDFAVSPTLPPKEIWPAVVFIGLGATLLGNLFWNFGIHVLGPTASSQFLFLAPMCSVVFGIIWLNETLTALGWFGMALVLSGLVLSVANKVKEQQV
ncbi:MAG: DMT family transporter, partial [Phycisphaerales bacterium]|nr:DMT family transporter [Phycisphaerales bacterium]